MSSGPFVGYPYNASDLPVTESAMQAAPTKATPVDADGVILIDSAASNAIKRTLWSDLKNTLSNLFQIKLLTGYVSGAGSVVATDTVLQAIQKLNGNDATNANLTGPITSVGNATSVAAQTGTGSTFAMQTSPAFLTDLALGPLVTGETKSLRLVAVTGGAFTEPVFRIGLTGVESTGLAFRSNGNVQCPSGIALGANSDLLVGGASGLRVFGIQRGASGQVFYLGGNTNDSDATFNITGNSVVNANVAYRSKTSTTNDIVQSVQRNTWIDSTHATRKARWQLDVYDTGVREAIRVDSTGSAAQVGICGAVSGSAALTVNGSTKLGIRTIATLPSAASSSGERFQVSDSATIVNRIAFSNGSAWYYEGTAVAV